MPVYNSEQYLTAAIESILEQTFLDFEFIIIDDGSSDNSKKIINGFKDKRIILKQNKFNQGNYRCRNAGMKMAKGKYICVMDSDDISVPNRFQKQFRFMENNPDIGICGSFIKNIPSNLSHRFITDNDQLKVAFLSNNFCSHPSLIMRKKLLDKFDLYYNEDFYYSADFDLCVRGFRYFKVQNIPEVLLNYRRHPAQISSAKFDEQTKYADTIRINQIIDIFGFEVYEIPVLLHLKLMKRLRLCKNEVDEATIWVKKILEKNNSINYFNQSILERFLFSCFNIEMKLEKT